LASDSSGCDDERAKDSKVEIGIRRETILPVVMGASRCSAPFLLAFYALSPILIKAIKSKAEPASEREEPNELKLLSRFLLSVI